MKTATVTEVQRHLSEILRWVHDGEVVVITKHRREVANIVPSESKRKTLVWPDFAARARKNWQSALRGKPVSRIIIDERDERL